MAQDSAASCLETFLPEQWHSLRGLPFKGVSSPGWSGGVVLFIVAEVAEGQLPVTSGQYSRVGRAP